MHMFQTPSEMFWLNATNIGLGVVVLICFGVVAASLLQEWMGRVRARQSVHADIDRDMAILLGADDHAFHMPGLGLTMADGGERTTDRKARKRS
jgi:hypothetical protein